MAKKILSAILSLKDKDFSTNMKKAAGGVKDFDRKVNYSRNQIKKFKNEAVSSFSSIAKSAVGLAGAYIGFRSLNNFKNESVDLAKKQIEAETKLAAVMKNTKGVTDQHIQSIKDYASVVQNLGVIGDEVQLAGVQQLATFQLQADTLKTIMPGMADLIAQQKGLNATQEDAVTIGNMIGKVMNGQVGALSRAGINFTKAQEQVLKFGNEQQKAANLAEVLKMNVGGVNKAMAETDQGKIQQMTNAWGDYKEEVGKKILPLQAQFAGWFVKKIPGIQKLVLGSIDKFSNGINKFKDISTSAFEKTKKIIENNRPAIEFIKTGLIGLALKSQSVRDWFVSAFQNIKAKIEENRPTIDGVKAVLENMGLKALALKEWLVGAFEHSKPGINWLKDEGLPLVVDGIAGLLDKAKSLYDFINDNWTKIEPIVYGIAGGILFYKGAITAVTIATTIWGGVTKAMALAQGALNVAMGLSPLTWVAIAIGAVIAVGVLLYRNWDTIKEKGLALWDGLNGVFTSIGEGFSNMWTGMKDGAKAGINFIIDGLNSMITGFNNFASFQVPDWVPGIGGKGWELSIPKIPKFAHGTSYFTGGLARINERGGEIVDLPNGSRVYPHDKSVQMAKRERENIFYITINAKDKSTAEIVNELVPQLKLALANM